MKHKAHHRVNTLPCCLCISWTNVSAWIERNNLMKQEPYNVRLEKKRELREETSRKFGA